MHIYHIRLLVYFLFTTMLILQPDVNDMISIDVEIKFCLSPSLSESESESLYLN